MERQLLHRAVVHRQARQYRVHSHRLIVGMWRDLVSRECDIITKYFAMLTLELHNCASDLDSNTHAILFLNDNDSAILLRLSHCECHWSMRSTLQLPMLINQRVGHHHASDGNVVIHWYGRRQNMHCSSSTDTRDVKQVLKHSCCCWSRKSNTSSLFNHTSLFL